MNTASEKAKTLMKERGQRPADVARATGMKIGTYYNVLSGAPSHRARQKLTNFFRTQIWPGVFPSPGMRFEAGTIFVFSNLEQAREMAAEIGEGGERRDRFVRLSADLQMTSNEHASEKSEPVGKAGDTIDIYSGEDPPDSPFVESLRNHRPNEEKSPARQRRGQGRAAKSQKASKPAAATGYTVSDQP